MRSLAPALPLASLAMLLWLCCAWPAGAADPDHWREDASRGPIPAVSLQGRLFGRPIGVQETVLRNSGSITAGDLKVEQYALRLRSPADPFGDAEFEASVVVAVRKGQRVDGRIFRQVPVSAKASLAERIKAQPAAIPGFPDVQGIRLEGLRDGERETLDDSAENGLTCRVEFGKRAGGKLPGKVFLCARDPQKSYVVGTFVAVLK